jgi:hypothetical protein
MAVETGRQSRRAACLQNYGTAEAIAKLILQPFAMLGDRFFLKSGTRLSGKMKATIQKVASNSSSRYILIDYFGK